MTVHIAVDILCNWFGYPPAYRIYVDDDLLTERSYIWDNSHQYIREHLQINLDPGTHVMKLESVEIAGSQAAFGLRGLTVNDAPKEFTTNTVTFTV